MLTLERRWTRTQTAALLVVQTQRAQNKIDEKKNGLDYGPYGSTVLGPYCRSTKQLERRKGGHFKLNPSIEDLQMTTRR